MDEVVKVITIIGGTLAALLASLTLHSKVFLPQIMQAFQTQLDKELDRRDKEREKLFDALLGRVIGIERQIDRLRDRTPLQPYPHTTGEPL